MKLSEDIACYGENLRAHLTFFTKEYITPEFALLVYKSPAPYIETCKLDEKGNITNLKPASINVIRELLNEINQFNDSMTKISFKGRISKDIVYLRGGVSPVIIFYDKKKNIKLSFKDGEFEFNNLNLVFILSGNNIMAYRYNGEAITDDTILYKCLLPNVFENYICTGNTKYTLEHIRYWEDAIDYAKEFFYGSKFSDNCDAKVMYMYNDKTYNKKDKKCTIKKLIDEFI